MRIDVSKGAKHVVTFVNNLEKDSMYARWPRALKQLSYPTWSLHSIQVRPSMHCLLPTRLPLPTTPPY